MTKKILTFGASSSKKSINKQLATYAANLFKNAKVELLDLNDFEMPIYSMDKEKEDGIPQLAHDFYEKIGESDLIVISFAEHNGAYSSAFKNIFDWMSRINRKTFQEKPVLLLATSPGARGGSSVLEIANKRFPFQGAIVKGSFSLPSFNDNFDAEKGITNEDLKKDLLKIVDSIEY
ncbi:NADPH-dependent FMN reductase [Flavobacterium aquatile]|uniref:NADPH-dependent FMN reductase n=1 Tax=Flavobacterium aquatile LMG 4008 = ATCC 11947 TaxID=1453498 RepID=A0A095U3U2_9FLAO|nr:NAD(P)H-dependent oxidoreductase [Flavobacterium aquatile]KGD69248.1 NADPH-dependent FMN reductase [Flavobacterium aquatile LMG 4008 = ATCC 11947]OXA69500.1 NADPH-dependent oxidoreductase [Flavobacterium aquatile LMG 4008 = ATCC 11947]GEC79759.1 FMN reductase [Flavobacterium aquatile]